MRVYNKFFISKKATTTTQLNEFDRKKNKYISPLYETFYFSYILVESNNKHSVKFIQSQNEMKLR